MVRLEQAARVVAAGLLLLYLSSCSRFAFVDAAFVNGRLGFILAPGQPDRGTRCLFQLRISNEAGETVWEFQGPPRRLDSCEPWLPLLYRQAPPDMQTLVPAQRLRMEVAYILYGNDGDSIEGAFVLHRWSGRISVENLAWSSDRVANAQEAARHWQDEQSHRAFENAHRPENEFEGPFEDRPLPPEQR
jgi:hypothetical protein